MQSSSQSQFARAPQQKPQRSVFDRSFQHKTTFNAGYLVPVYVDEVLPGDTFNLKMSSFARLATPIFPIMDNMRSQTAFFSVPIRILWDHWPNFNGEQKNPGDSTDFIIPQMQSPLSTGYEAHSLSDYFGIPTNVPLLNHSALFHRAYNKIYNEWYRSQDLQNSVPEHTHDGPDDPNDYPLLKKCKVHDYFTSCLPAPQKGKPIEFNLQDQAPVKGIGYDRFVTANNTTSNSTVEYSDGTSEIFQAPRAVAGAQGDRLDVRLKASTAGSGYANDIYADLSGISATSINELRLGFQLQAMLERDARSGTRYTEVILSNFGVRCPDYRLQRPEYLGGSMDMINTTPVAQTSSTDSSSPQGNLGAFATFSGQNQGFVKSFTEHCIIIGLQYVTADLNYQQGLNRMFSRKTKEDHYWPLFSGLGEQAVLNKEIYAQATADDEKAFGYQERYSEYKYKPNQITGHMRSNYAQSLDSWHLAQNFGTLPVLGPDFITENPPIDRIKALQADYPDFIYDSFFRLHCTRCMPTYCIPGSMHL